MFGGRLQIRIFADALRSWSRGRSKKPIRQKHELTMLFTAIFGAEDTYIRLNPLDEEGHLTWRALIHASRENMVTARKLALAFAEWLEEKYVSSEPIQFEDQSDSIMVLGVPYWNLRPEGYAIIKVLAYRRGDYVPADAIGEAINSNGLGQVVEPTFKRLQPFPLGATGNRRISRAISYLPQGLRKHIDGQQGRGRRLILKP